MIRKKNLAILLNENFTKKNKYYHILKDLNKNFNLFFFIIPFGKKKIIRKKNFFYISKFSKIKSVISKYDFSYSIDLLLYPDIKNNNKKYLSILKNNKKLRDIFKFHQTKSLRFYHAALSKWNYFPYKSLILPKFIYRKIRNFFLPDWKKDIIYNYLIAPGNLVSQNLYFGTTKIIYSHHLDFDMYIKSSNKKIKSKNYAVYIDQMIGEHPDYKLGSTTIKFSNNFQKELANFFFNIKKYLNLNVKICPHPKRKISKKFIFKRKINIKHSNYNLIKNCKLVMGHDSAAISLAIIFKKPLIFLVSDNIKNKKKTNRIKQYAEFFDQTTFNISTNIQDRLNNDIFVYNNSAYKRYFDDFIKHPKSEKLKISEHIIKGI